MADAKLTITVSADVKKAAQQLKSLGYNIQDVKKDTDKANESADLWSKTLKKGAHDSVEQIVALGAKFLTVTTVVTAAYKAIKACVTEALKENKEAQEKINKINGVWTEIKKNLGQNLLDTVTPALDKLYQALLKIQEWGEKTETHSDYVASLKAANKSYNSSGSFSVKSWSDDSLQMAIDNIYNVAGAEWSQYTMDFADALVAAAKDELATRKASDDSGVKHGGKGGTFTINGAVNGRDKLNEIVNTLGDGANNWLPTLISEAANAESLLAELKESAEGYTGPDNYFDVAADYVQDYINALNNAKEKQLELLDNLSLFGTEAMNIWSGIADLKDAIAEKDIANIEASTASEEEKNTRIEQIEKEQFDRQKRLSMAQATMSGAQALLSIYEKYSGNPWVLYPLLATTAIATGLQIATISQQNFAQGGIVSGPTRALIGEGGEKEAVMPLSKLDEFVSRPESSGTIVINVSVNGSGEGTAEDVYYAIERAQRTGLLPKWRYA